MIAQLIGEDGKHLDRISSAGLEVDVGVSAVTLHRLKHQIAAEVASVESGEGNSVSVTGQWGTAVVSLNKSV